EENGGSTAGFRRCCGGFFKLKSPLTPEFVEQIAQ
ncbi:MAG: hypothetical protein RLZ47_1714, partial [Bacteroidota bacterium]